MDSKLVYYNILIKNKYGLNFDKLIQHIGQ